MKNVIYSGDIPLSQIPVPSLQQISIQYFINKKEKTMNKTMKRVIASVLLLLIILPGFAIAQDSDEDKKKAKPTVVISQNMVPFVKMSRYLEIAKEYWAPGLDKLVDEGKLLSWGSLTHAWGDEWNILIYYNAKDFATFEKAWGEAYKSFTESAPEEVISEMMGMISAHKDNIYTVEYFYDGHSQNKE